jgi:hypothetical protein
LEEIRSPVGRPDFKSGKGRQSVLGGFDSHSFPPTISDSLAGARDKVQGARCKGKDSGIALADIIAKSTRFMLKNNEPSMPEHTITKHTDGNKQVTGSSR